MLITKGELLTALGADANKFTAFMLDPGQFGATEPYISAIKIAKQQLDWTSNIETDLPEIQQLINLLKNFGVFSDANIVAINNITHDVNKYIISVIAQDNITIENIYGAEKKEQFWNVRIDFVNETTSKTITEIFSYDFLPTEDDIQTSVALKIHELKQIK